MTVATGQHFVNRSLPEKSSLHALFASHLPLKYRECQHPESDEKQKSIFPFEVLSATSPGRWSPDLVENISVPPGLKDQSRQGRVFYSSQGDQ